MKTYLLLAALALAPAVAAADPDAEAASAAARRVDLLSQGEGLTRFLPAMGGDSLQARLRARLEAVKARLSQPDAGPEQLRLQGAELESVRRDLFAYLYQRRPREAGTSFEDFSRSAGLTAEHYAEQARPRVVAAQAVVAARQRRIAEFLAADPKVAFDGGAPTPGAALDLPSPSAPVPAVAAAPAPRAAAVPASPEGRGRYAGIRAMLLSRGVDPRIIDTAIDEGVRQKVDPMIVLSVIEQESRYKRTAYNKGSGCVGLMQLAPGTARDMGVRDASLLYDIRTNIRAGVKYLDWIANRFFKMNLDMSDMARVPVEKLKIVLASYNWGIGNVQNTLRRRGVAALDRVAPKETRDYIAQIPARISAWFSSLVS